MSSSHVPAKEETHFAPRTTSMVTRQLLADHDRATSLMEQLKPPLLEICRRQSSDDLKQVQDTLQQLIDLMNMHSACEESAVFPALARYHPLPVLEAEHDEILIKRAALMSGLMNYSFPEDCSDVLYKQAMIFFDMCERHMRKEECSIFPLLESSLNAEEKHDVLLKMEAIKAQAEISPTEETHWAVPTFERFHVPIGEPLHNAIESRTLLEHKALRIKLLTLQAGESLADHWSPAQATLLVVEGKANGSFGEKFISLSAGDGVVMDARLSHSLTAETNCRLVAFFM